MEDTVLKTNTTTIARPPNTATVIIALSAVEMMLVKISSIVLKHRDITLKNFLIIFIVTPPSFFT